MTFTVSEYDLRKTNLSLEAIILDAFIREEIMMHKLSHDYGYTENVNKDEDGIYVIITNQTMKDLLRIKSTQKLVKVKRELEEIGYIKQKRTLDNSNKYYYIRKG